jgi:hypothetical protein
LPSAVSTGIIVGTGKEHLRNNMTNNIESPAATKKKREGTPGTNFRFDAEIRAKLDKLVEAHSAESGMIEDRSSVLRRLIANDYHRRVSTCER